jgi:hypothetical protein
MGIMSEGGGELPFPLSTEPPEETVAAQIEQAMTELHASRGRSQQIQVEIDRLAKATDEVLARIKDRLITG